MQFNPKIGFYLGILVTIEIAVSSGALSLAHAVPDAWIATVVAWSGILAFIGSTVLTFLHGYSSGEPGPLVKAPPIPPGVVKAAAVVLLVLSAGLIASGSAHAQTPRPAPARQFTPTGDLIKDIAASKAGGQAQTNQTELDLVDKIQKLSLPDFQFALAMSIATKNVISTPCWQAWVDLISAQQKPLLAADGTTPLVEPDPHLITSIERISELLAVLRPDSTVTTACAALAGAAGKDVATLVGGILSGGALGLFKLPIVPIP